MDENKVKEVWSTIVKDIHPTWITFFNKDCIKNELYKSLYKSLDLHAQAGGHSKLCPHIQYMLLPFVMSNKNMLKVFIFGQDPYPSLINACGIAFSVSNPSLSDINVPASLKPIFTSLRKFEHIKDDDHGCLYNWVNQGVMLFNITPLILLDASQTLSNKLKDIWSIFTNTFISELSKEHPNLIWVLWGGPAKGKLTAIDDYINKEKNGLIHQYRHPSPQANNVKPLADRFESQDHFGNINKALLSLGGRSIDWNITQTTNIYVDGACSKNNIKDAEVRESGYAIVFASGPFSGQIYYQNTTNINGQVSTSNRSELFAFIKVLEICMRHQFIGPLIIHTDSEYTYNVFTSWLFTWDSVTIEKKANPDLIKTAKQFNDVMDKYYAKYGGIQIRHIERNSNKYAILADEYSKKAKTLSHKDVIVTWS